jgi:hypothetical protein
VGSLKMARISLLLHVRPVWCLCAWDCTAVLTRDAGVRTRSDKQISFDEFCVWWEVSDDHHRPALRHQRLFRPLRVAVVVLTQAEEMGRATVKGSTVAWVDDGSGFYVGDAAGNITHFSSEGQQLAVLQPA